MSYFYNSLTNGNFSFVKLKCVLMKPVNFPHDYQQVMPYLILKNAESFLEFTKKVFGATEKMKHMRDEKTVMHAEVKIGESVIMFAEATEQWGAQTGGLFVYVEDADATYRKALEEGGTSIMEPADQEYGRSGGVSDPCGNSWWITSVKQ